MYVIFAPGNEVLPLVIEALAVLPREKAWTTSFSTYFTKLPAGVDCLWRFVLDGSPEAQQVRAASHSRKIDLVELRQSRLPAPDDNPFVQAARAGTTAELEAPAVMSAPAAPSPMMPAAETPAQPEPVRAVNPFAGPRAAPASPFGRSNVASKISSKLPWILGGSALVLLLGVVVLVYSMLTKDIPPRVAASDPDRAKNHKRSSNRTDIDVDFRSERQKAREAFTSKEFENTPMVLNTKTPNRQGPAVAEKPTSKYIDLGAWNEDILAKNRLLPLPERAQTFAPLDFNPVPIARIRVHNPRSIDLKIHEPRGRSNAQRFVFQVDDEESDEGLKLRRWILQRKAFNPYGSQELGTQYNVSEVGMFELTEQSLTFGWNMKAPPWTKPLSLQYCLLEIIHYGQSEMCQLSTPKKVPPAKLLEKSDEIFGKDKVIPLAIKSNAVDDPESLRLNLQFDGFNDERIPGGKALKMGDKVKFPLFDGRVDFEIVFDHDKNEDPLLVVNAYSERRFVENLKPADLNNAHKLQIKPTRRSTTPGTLKMQKEAAEDAKRKLLRAPIYVASKQDLPLLEAKLASRKTALSRAMDDKARKSIQEDINRIDGLIEKTRTVVNGYNNVIQLADKNIAWANEMQSHFAELQKTARIGYAIYTEIEERKIYLVQSQSQREPSPDSQAKKP